MTLKKAIYESPNTAILARIASFPDYKMASQGFRSPPKPHSKPVLPPCLQCGSTALGHVCPDTLLRSRIDLAKAVGFTNNIGDSNCFLNAALQGL